MWKLYKLVFCKAQICFIETFNTILVCRTLFLFVGYSANFFYWILYVSIGMLLTAHSVRNVSLGRQIAYPCLFLHPVGMHPHSFFNRFENIFFIVFQIKIL
jgi:hypothetical protein